MKNLLMLDVSFNMLVGEIPNDISAKNLKFIFLTHNLLTGNVPDTILQDGRNIDLSYNDFTYLGPQQPACQENMKLNINLFRSSSTENSLRRVLPCSEAVDCPPHRCSVYLNCGGNDLTINDKDGKFVYEGDAAVAGGVSTYFKNSKSFWGFSSTGDFMDDNDLQNVRYIQHLPSSNLSELYTTARISPISLTYFSYCLENGNYTVNLLFAEIYFANDGTYRSLGKRIFDVYIQDKLVQKQFNIEDEADGAQKPLIKQFNTSVTNSTLEIQFYWAGKGTTRIPHRGVYGPLVSAIAVKSNFKHCSKDLKKGALYIIVGVVMFSITLLVLCVLWWRFYSRDKQRKEEDLRGSEVQAACYSLKQIKAATNNFDSANKIGEGGFGPVYQGLLPNGTVIAVKQLSSRSKQGSQEFLNEVGLITCLQHPNLVRLYGCCTEAEQFLLIYEYMENNSLAHTLFEGSQLMLDWPTRIKICIGIARGLAFLHEESQLRIVHRDIKATNVLLDRDLNPKISDFGLARLNEEEKTHISTRVAGTIGYMAPEYALWGYLTSKADVYSYGVVVMEVVTGKSNSSFVPMSDFCCLLEWACRLQQRENYSELVDRRLGGSFDVEEAERLVKVSLLCTNGSPSLRPPMSDVVSMLEGRLNVPDVIPEPGTFSDDSRFKAMREIFRHQQGQSSNIIGTQRLTNAASIGTQSLTNSLADIGSSSACSH
ncbi:hypothetical protein Nepgr_007041 [Nepenthes gracilis]|uniref:non-specific serine/threonine protein kinase n=1 Tax=Nepenthes gracilis TaxID=150966 RepID=A0AAD3S6E5_NEPGR|nr:hypothetical protein Nepgr_007041 [Nepenthes gracilis]